VIVVTQMLESMITAPVPADAIGVAVRGVAELLKVAAAVAYTSSAEAAWISTKHAVNRISRAG